MPHIILEYSTNLEDEISSTGLLERLHGMLGEVETFASDRLKSRAVACRSYLVGAEPERGFVHVSVVFSPGRGTGLRDELGRRMLDMLQRTIRPADTPVSRSVEIRQFEPDMYFNDYETEAVQGNG